MHFDDRLATVLRQAPAGGEAFARVQYRQLLDLLGTLERGASSPTIEAGYRAISRLSSQISAADRRTMIEDPALRLRSMRLVALLAEDEPPVATAAIKAANLTEAEWSELVPGLPVRARGILRHRRDLGAKVDALLDRLGIGDRGLPAAEPVTAAAPAEPAQADAHPGGTVVPYERPAEPPRPSEDRQPEETRKSIGAIGAIVRRIEEFRKSRDSSPSPAANPRLPLGDNENDTAWTRLRWFDFATDAQARIVWADASGHPAPAPMPAPMVVGMPLAARAGDGPAAASAAMVRAMAQRQPLRGAALTIEGAPAVEGQWLAVAAPRFDEATGRFLGYAGRMWRQHEPATGLDGGKARPGAGQTDPGAGQGGSAAMRQVLHELRTPLTAIQGGAEIIQQQVFGTAPHEYRALAATIASDAATILAGFDELDRLVKLDAGAMELDAGESDLGRIVSRIAAQLQPHTEARNGGFAIDIAHEDLRVGLHGEELERIVWRLLASLVGATAPGEVLDLRCFTEAGGVGLSAVLPAALARMDDEALFRARTDNRHQALSSGMFGLGFTLRLIAAEAASVGGSFARRNGAMELRLPSLTASSSGLSDAV